MYLSVRGKAMLSTSVGGEESAEVKVSFRKSLELRDEYRLALLDGLPGAVTVSISVTGITFYMLVLKDNSCNN